MNPLQGTTRSWISILSTWALTLTLMGTMACESNSNSQWSHKPPAGQGCLIVDNQTADDIDVYFSGYYLMSVDRFDHELSDRNPGLYRIVLDQSNGDRAYRDDVDMIEGQLTVMEVTRSGSGYSVRIYFDN